MADEPQDPSPEPPPQTEPGTPPPAAAVVVKGKRTEATADLEAELETTRKKLKDTETRICLLEDENRTLKTPPKPPVVPPKSRWLEGATFFG